METDRKLIGSLLLALVSFLAIAVWITPASAANATASQTTGQTGLKTLHRGPTTAGFPKHAAYGVKHKAWPKKAAKAANQALPTPAAPLPPAVSHNSAPDVACYSGCIPYDTRAAYTWNVPATAGQAQITYWQPAQPQAPVSLPLQAPSAGPQAFQAPPPCAACVPASTCYNGCVSYPSAQSSTWYGPAPVSTSPGQIYGQLPSGQRPKRLLKASARTGRALPGRAPAKNGLTGRTAVAANNGASYPAIPAYGWNQPASAGAVQGPSIPVQPTFPPAPAVTGPPPAVPPATFTCSSSWPQWLEAPYYRISSLFSSSCP